MLTKLNKITIIFFSAIFYVSPKKCTISKFTFPRPLILHAPEFYSYQTLVVVAAILAINGKNEFNLQAKSWNLY